LVGYRELKRITCRFAGSATLTVRGTESRYYLKQAAQEAVRMTRKIERVVNMIEVKHCEVHHEQPIEP
jgi:hypothetical protein